MFWGDMIQSITLNKYQKGPGIFHSWLLFWKGPWAGLTATSRQSQGFLFRSQRSLVAVMVGVGTSSISRSLGWRELGAHLAHPLMSQQRTLKQGREGAGSWSQRKWVRPAPFLLGHHLYSACIPERS